MENHILKIPGSFEEISLSCPKCSSNQITISLDPHGYFDIIECKKCGWKKV